MVGFLVLVSIWIMSTTLTSRSEPLTGKLWSSISSGTILLQLFLKLFMSWFILVNNSKLFKIWLGDSKFHKCNYVIGCTFHSDASLWSNFKVYISRFGHKYISLLLTRNLASKLFRLNNKELFKKYFARKLNISHMFHFLLRESRHRRVNKPSIHIKSWIITVQVLIHYLRSLSQNIHRNSISFILLCLRWELT